MTAATSPRFDAIRFVCCTVLTAHVVAIVARDYPLVGSDLRYYIPRLLDTLIHHQVNGALAIQWYTPAFGGGLPAFPNPQHLQHSVLQALTAFVNPWVAYLLTGAAALCAGFYAFAAVLQNRLGLGRDAATLGAIFYIGNGFFIEHLIIGHVGFQLLPLAAVMVATCLDEDRPLFARGCALALIVCAMLYHAGIYSIFLSAFSLSLVLPVIAIIRPGCVRFRSLAIVVAIALPIATAIAAPRLSAALSFLRQFPREIEDLYEVGLLQALAGLLAQLVGSMTLAPLFVVAGIEPGRLYGALARLTGASDRFGIWELDVGLSPIAWMLLALAAGRALAHVRRDRLPEIQRQTWIACGLGAVIAWLLVEATLARGFVYPLLKPLPILRSLHVNPRIAVVFIMPLAIIAATTAHRRYGPSTDRRTMAVLLSLAVVAPASYFLFPGHVQGRAFDLTLSLDTDQRIRARESFVVDRIVDAAMHDPRPAQ